MLIWLTIQQNNDNDDDMKSSSVDQLRTPSTSVVAGGEHIPAAADQTVTSRDTAAVHSTDDVASHYPTRSLVGEEDEGSQDERRPSSVDVLEATDDKHRSELVHPNDVLKALKAFVEETNKHRSL